MAIRPQVEWILDDRGNVMVDFIGKVENIEEDFKTVSDRLGLGSSALKTHNQSDTQKWDAYLRDEEDYEYLYIIFQKDFEILGYDPNLRS